MATTYYNLPTINGTDTIDGVNAINGLANAVDSALHDVSSNASTVPGANSVNTAAIQDGAVTSEKLNSTVQSQIQQALDAVSAPPTSVLASTSKGTIRAHKYGPLVVIQFHGTSMTLTSGANDVGRVQSNACPASQVENATTGTVSKSVSGIYATADGRIGLWALEGGSNVDVRGSLTYFVGV